MGSDPQFDRLRGHGWLPIGHREVAGDAGPPVACPFRTSCSLATCLQCDDFAAIGVDPPSGETFVVCARASDRSPPESILTQQLRDFRGDRWTVNAYAQPRPDGTWDGWLEFERCETGARTRTGALTNERCRSALDTWALELSKWNGRGFWIAHELAASARPFDR